MVMGIGPIEYLQRWRMALAKDELRRSTRSIGEIALAIGFQSASAFSTAFTRAVGISPRSFSDTEVRRAATLRPMRLSADEGR
jgi:AraC-like DNA-binding protein